MLNPLTCVIKNQSYFLLILAWFHNYSFSFFTKADSHAFNRDPNEHSQWTREGIIAFASSTSHPTIQVSELLKSPLIHAADEECDNFSAFHEQNPSYFPTAYNKYVKFSNGPNDPPLQKNDTTGMPAFSSPTEPSTTIFKNSMCKTYIIDGNVKVCGDLSVRGRLTVVTGFNATGVFDQESEYVQRHCILKPLHRKKNVSFPVSNVWIVGRLDIGGNLSAAEFHIDAGAVVHVGLRATRETIKVETKHNFTSNNNLRSGIHRQYFTSNLFNNFFASDQKEIKEAFNSLESPGTSINILFPCHILDGHGQYIDLVDSDESDTHSVLSSTNSFPCKENCTLTNAHRRVKRRIKISDTSSQHNKNLNSTHNSDSFGDLSVISMSIHNAGRLFVYGNVYAEQNVVIDGASYMYSHCGSLFSNARENVTGIIVDESSQLLFFGIGSPNVVSRLIVRDASDAVFMSRLLVSSMAQAWDGSTLLSIGSVLCLGIVIDGSSLFMTSGYLDSSSILQSSSQSTVVILKHVIAAAIQVFSRSFIRVRQGIDLSAFLTMENSSLTCESKGIRTKYSVQLTDFSTLTLESDNFDISRQLKLRNSNLYVKAGSLVTEQNILIGKNSVLQVWGDLKAIGSDAPFENPVFENINDLYILNEENAEPIKVESQEKEDISVNTNLPDVPNRLLQELDNEADNQKSQTTIDIKAQPALFISSSYCLIKGNVYAERTWSEISEATSLIVLGDQGIRLNDGFLMISGMSKVEVTNAKIVADLGLSAKGNSTIYAKGQNQVGNIQIAGRTYIEFDGSLEITGNAVMDSRSRLHVSDNLNIGGELLYIDEDSSLVTGSIIVKEGDIFVEDRSFLVTSFGSIQSKGSVVCQDRASIKSNLGIFSEEGHVISENGATITAHGEISAANGLLRKTMESQIVAGNNSSIDVSIFLQEFPENAKGESLNKLPNIEGSEINELPDIGPILKDPSHLYTKGQTWKDVQGDNYQTSLSPKLLIEEEFDTNKIGESTLVGAGISNSDISDLSERNIINSFTFNQQPLNKQSSESSFAQVQGENEKTELQSQVREQQFFQNTSTATEKSDINNSLKNVSNITNTYTSTNSASSNRRRRRKN